MTRISNVRKTTKFKRSIKAISPVIATLLMIAIAVVASLVVYAWVTGYIGGTTSTAGKAIQIQSFASQGGYLVIYVQNVGQGDVQLNQDQSVYVNSNLVSITSPAQAKIPIQIGQTVELLTNAPYTAGTKVNIKVTTTDGTFMTTTGTGTSNANPTAPPGNVAPTAAFTSVPTGLSVAFTDASTDSDGTIASWAWNFGDGATSTEQNPTHVYTSANTYTVTLTVTDNNGASSSPVATHDVIVAPINVAPTAAFTSVPTGLSVAFTDASTDSDGTIASWAWNFGDSGTSAVQSPSHTYASAGTYTVSLTVTDNDGAPSSPVTHDVIVNAPAASKLVYTAVDSSVQRNHVSTVFTVQRQDQYNNPTTSGSITLALDDGTNSGHFYSDSAGQHEITTLTIPDGSSSASFYWAYTGNYQGGGYPSRNLTASYNGLTTATTTVAVTN